jgi:hypothetical protein
MARFSSSDLCTVLLPLHSGSVISPHTDGNYYVKYRPALNQHSGPQEDMFDTFTVSAQDGVSGEASGSDGGCVGVVAVSVESVNDSPYASADLTG